MREYQPNDRRNPDAHIFVAEHKKGGFLKSEGGMRHLVKKPIDADKFDSMEETRAAASHFGKQDYVAVSYSSVKYMNDLPDFLLTDWHKGGFDNVEVG